MNDIYFTITGTNFRYGQDFFEPDQQVKLIRDPDNEHDKEAIKVEMPGLGQVGWVANSVNTVLGESHSAGWLCDKIFDGTTGTVLYVLPQGVVCKLDVTTNDYLR